jgi:HTH-type transcriptional regulator/antitoxin HigA
MDIHPIRTEADYEAALAAIERLFAAPPHTPEGDRLEVFATLVEAYEEQHYSIPTPDPIEAITYYRESRGLGRRDLEPYLGSRARVAAVLNRKRPLSLEMIRRLHTGLGIGAEILIQSYPMAAPAPNTCSEGDCQGVLTVVPDAFARVWITDAPRRCRAWR